MFPPANISYAIFLSFTVFVAIILSINKQKTLNMINYCMITYDIIAFCHKDIFVFVVLFFWLIFSSSFLTFY